MKKAIIFAVSLILSVSMMIPETIFIGYAKNELGLIASTGALIDEESFSLKTGKATFKVTLPAGGYVQLDNKLTGFINGTEKPTVYLIPGEGSSSDYASVRAQIQLSPDQTAKSDIVPVNEYTSTPANDGMTWIFWGTDSLIWCGRGANTQGGLDLVSPKNTDYLSKGLKLSFEMNEGKVNGVFSGTGKTLTSKLSLSDISGQDGVYVRIRNGSSKDATYTVVVESGDIKSQSVTEESETFNFKSENGLSLTATTGASIDEKSASLKSGKASFKVTLPAEGYVQLDNKLTGFINGTDIPLIYVIPGAGAESDYASVRAQVQLSPDQTAKSDIVPVNEYTSTPASDGMTWIFWGTDSLIWCGRGANTQGGLDLVSPKNADYLGNGLKLSFEMNDGKVNGVFSGTGKTLTSKLSLSDISGQDGVYLRIRNGGTTDATYTVVVASSDIVSDIDTTHKEGNWIFSDEEARKVSATSTSKNGVYTEKLTATLPSGGYVQLDKKLAYFLNNEKANIILSVGKGSVEEFDNLRAQIQLTADATAKKDIVPVDERTSDPGTDGMTWIFWGTPGRMWTGKGSTTAGGGYYTQTDLIATMHGGLRLKFNTDENEKVIYDTTVGGLSIQGNLPSTKTLDEIGASEGVFIRLRNGASSTVTYTITINYTLDIIEQKPIESNGWIVKGQTENGAEIKNETKDVIPGYRVWNMTLPNNSYAQCKTKITDLKDASFVFDPGDYSTPNLQVMFAFTLDKDAPWNVKAPGGDPKQFLIVMRPGSDPTNTHLLFPTGKTVEGYSNNKPTVTPLLTSKAIETAGGFNISFVKDEGHWYVNISGLTISAKGTALEEYLRMDEYVKKGAYFRIYTTNLNSTYAYVQTSIHSAAIPENAIEEKTENQNQAMLDFIEYFTDNIDRMKNREKSVYAKLYKMWAKLSYIEKSNVEAYFLDDDEPTEFISYIRDFAKNTKVEDRVEEVTNYETVYSTEYIPVTVKEEKTGPIVMRRKKKKKAAKQDDFPLGLVVGISAAALFVIAGATTAVIVVKKKKSAKKIG